MNRLRDRSRDLTPAKYSTEEEILAQRNPLPRGLKNYFRKGTCSPEFLKMDRFVYGG